MKRFEINLQEVSYDKLWDAAKIASRRSKAATRLANYANKKNNSGFRRFKKSEKLYDIEEKYRRIADKKGYQAKKFDTANVYNDMEPRIRKYAHKLRGTDQSSRRYAFNKAWNRGLGRKD